MPAHANRLHLEQSRPLTPSCPLDGCFCGSVDLDNVVAVDRNSRNAVGGGAIRKSLDGYMFRGGRRVSKAIVLDNNDNCQSQRGGEIEPLVEIAGIRATITDIRQGH